MSEQERESTGDTEAQEPAVATEQESDLGPRYGETDQSHEVPRADELEGAPEHDGTREGNPIDGVQAEWTVGDDDSATDTA